MGRQLCLIPGCREICKQYKNGKYQNYCINHNWKQMKQHTDWKVLRSKVLRRDKYKCVKCGDSRRRIIMPIKQSEIEKEEFLPGSFAILKYKIIKKRKMITNLEADHIKEIADGGNQWDINNIQTLCYRCHKEKTAAFNSRPRYNSDIEKLKNSSG